MTTPPSAIAIIEKHHTAALVEIERLLALKAKTDLTFVQDVGLTTAYYRRDFTETVLAEFRNAGIA